MHKLGLNHIKKIWNYVTLSNGSILTFMPKLNHVLLLSPLRSLQQYFDIGTHSIEGKYERIIGLSQMP